MSSPSTHQDSPKVPWPKVVRAVGDPSYPNEGIALYKDGLPRGIEESEDLEVRTYIPVSALLSEKAKQAGRLALQEAAAQRPEEWANAVLQAAADALTGGNGE